MNRFLLTVLLIAFAAGLAGCADDGQATHGAPVFRKITDARLVPGDIVPDPQGNVVLSVSGLVGPAAGGDGVLDLDMPTLESLGLVEMRVDDWIAEGRTVVFQGVLLRTLLDVAQIEGGAHTLTMLALNDYTVDVPINDVTALPVLIATRADGERMSVEHYGPLRIVYPFGLLPLQQAIHEPRSIWQLYLIRVR